MGFEKNCVNFLKVLDSAKAAAQKMTTHAEADAEVAGLKERYDKVKSVSDTWVKKVDVLSRNGFSLTTPSLNSTPGSPRTSLLRARTSSPWRRWSLPLESSRTSSSRRRSWSKICKHELSLF